MKCQEVAADQPWIIMTTYTGHFQGYKYVPADLFRVFVELERQKIDQNRLHIIYYGGNTFEKIITDGHPIVYNIHPAISSRRDGGKN